MSNKIFDEFIIELREEDNFLLMYDKLRNNYIIDFLGLGNDKYDFSREEIIKIIEYSSLLAVSNDINNIEVSQKINSYLYYLYSDNYDILYGIQMIYSRVGNYPILEQKDVFEKNVYHNDSEFIIDTDLKNELNSGREKSKINIGKQEIFINKFQVNILEKINNNKLISISAPTSFGKSFIVRTYLSQIYSSNSKFSTLIIVPSKALIDDFIGEFVSMKKEFGFTFNIISHFIADEENMENKVFILTQERLLSVIRKNPEVLAKIDLLYCDEAHKVSFSGRGFLLKKVIEIFNLYSIDSKKIFTSPIIKNPNYFKDKFYSSMKDGYSHELVEYKPVEKNIFLFDINSTSTKYDVHFLDNVRGFEYKKYLINNEIDLDKSKNNDGKNKDLYKLDIILKSDFKGGTVIYINSKVKLLKYAQYLSKLIDEDNDNISKSEYKAIEDYINENFHEGLFILEFLKKGIGIHAGFLPVGLRNKVVELFKDKKIKYVLCTSTLLEGVNLPIKNIVLINNKSGKSNLGKLDFLNLIGRAGRFKYELSGNVVLFSDNNINFYDNYFDVNQEELVIKDVETNVLVKRPKKLEFFKFFNSKGLDGIYKKMDVDVYEHMLYGAYMEDDFIERIGLNEDEVVFINEKIKYDKKDNFYSKGIIEKNLGIAPHSQHRLYTKLDSFDNKELLDFFKIIEEQYSLKKDFTNVLKILQNIFSVVPSKYLSYNTKTKKRFFNPLPEYMRILNWIKGKSFKEVIDIDIYYYIRGILKGLEKYKEYEKLSDYYKYLEKEKIEIELEERIIKTLDYYNNIVGFNWTKYIRVFYNILFEILLERKVDINEEDYFNKVEGFLFTLETGINSPLGKYLYSKGLPRSLCIKVNRLVSFFISDIDEWNEEVMKKYFSKKRIKGILMIRLSKISYDELYFNLDIN